MTILLREDAVVLIAMTVYMQGYVLKDYRCLREIPHFRKGHVCKASATLRSQSLVAQPEYTKYKQC